MSEPLVLVTTKTDAQLAQELRDELTPLLQQVGTIMQRARNAGLTVGFNVTADQHGRFDIREINIVRPL